MDGGDSYPTIFISTMRSSIPASPHSQGVLSAVVGESPTKRLQEMNDMLVGSARKGRVVSGSGAVGSGGMAGGSSKQLFHHGKNEAAVVGGGAGNGSGSNVAYTDGGGVTIGWQVPSGATQEANLFLSGTKPPTRTA